MKKKIFILIVMVFLLTGCTNNYNVRLMFDGSIKEESNIRAESETLIGDKKITDSNKEEIVEILKSIKDVLGIDVNLEKVKYQYNNIIYKQNTHKEINNIIDGINDIVGGSSKNKKKKNEDKNDIKEKKEEEKRKEVKPNEEYEVSGGEEMEGGEFKNGEQFEENMDN